MEIKLKNLTKVFPGNPAKNIPDAVAVDSLNVDIRDGELIGLLGVILCLSGGAQAGGHGQTDRLYRVLSPETGRSGSQIESVLL